MRIELNGKDVELPGGANLGDAAREAGAPPEESPRGVAVALDGEVVPRAEWASTALAEGSKVEVLAAIQGGSPDLDPTSWELGGRQWSSRLIAGTGGFRSLGVMERAIAASGAEIATVALRRVEAAAPGSLVEMLDRDPPQPPWIAWRTSTRSPSCSSRRSHWVRGTTSASTATATPRRARSAPNEATTAPTVVPSARSRGSPLT